MISLKDEIRKHEALKLNELIEWCGGASYLAQLLDVPRAVVVNWIKRGRISSKGARDIDAMTSGLFKRSELRPTAREWWVNR